MSDDPVKLYVVLMTILLAILVFVAVTSYNQAQAYQRALDLAPQQSRAIRELSGEVTQLTTQLKSSDLRDKRPKAVISERARQYGIDADRITEASRPTPISGKVKERRFFIDISRKKPVTREKIAQFASAVERYTNGILKTIEVRIDRSGPGGQSGTITDDLYSGRVTFGFRYTE